MHRHFHSKYFFCLIKQPFIASTIIQRMYHERASRAVATYEADEANASGNFSASNLPRVNFSPQICLNLASGQIFASHLPQFCLGCFFASQDTSVFFSIHKLFWVFDSLCWLMMCLRVSYKNMHFFVQV